MRIAKLLAALLLLWVWPIEAQQPAAPTNLTVSMGGPPPALKINTITPPAGNVGVSYSMTFTSSGGTPPVTWSVVSGTLPAGLALNGSTGVLSGIPTAAGSSTFTIQCTDSTGGLAREVVH